MSSLNDDRSILETRHAHLDLSAASHPASHLLVTSERAFEALPNKHIHGTQKWDVLELRGPHDGRFVVRLHSATKTVSRLLSKRKFITLLHLCYAFFFDKTRSVDILLALGCKERNTAQKAISRLRTSLKVAGKELIRVVGNTRYRLDVRAIDEGDGFHLCRDCLPKYTELLNQIIRGMFKERCDKEPAVLEPSHAASNLEPIDFFHTQFVGAADELDGWAYGSVAATTLNVAMDPID